MTITNHTKMIEFLAGQVIADVDDRNYSAAHNDLDDIATRVRLAHEHVDHLQLIAERTFVPAGGS